MVVNHTVSVDARLSRFARFSESLLEVWKENSRRRPSRPENVHHLCFMCHLRDWNLWDTKLIPAMWKKCAVAVSSILKGGLSVPADCHTGFCNETALVVSTNEVIRATIQGMEGNLRVQSKIEDEDSTWKDILQHLSTLMDGYSELVQDVVSVCSTVTRGGIDMFYPPPEHLF
ncbi:hypothetical protein B0O80DRAFT_165616 [Mortierella sp. GBAus27b]|nr:hypothetical protein BGX31_005257 [Mortierella sp. GBA43]KAI8361688.1 hypothetical protein B0O80DRAFT_165616 [Mortierella sp. GBAus27b]